MASSFNCYKTKCEVLGEGEPWKFWRDEILNDRLSAIIYYHMPDIWQTVLDG